VSLPSLYIGWLNSPIHPSPSGPGECHVEPLSRVGEALAGGLLLLLILAQMLQRGA